MNFFGHALVAGRKRGVPRFVLGAMLPDLASMAGIRPAETADPELAAGVAFHHRTDDVFHRAPLFLQLCKEARAQLMARGVPRPQALAAAHVGIELVLDGLWTADPRAADDFLAALRAFESANDGIRWRHPDGARRWSALGDRLRTRGVPYHYRDPALVCAAVTHVLARRPRLALQPAHEPPVRACVADLQSRIGSAGDRLLNELETNVQQ